MKARIILSCILCSMISAEQLAGQTARRAEGQTTTLEDLDPNDGFDFVTQFAGSSWNLDFTSPLNATLLSNTIVDGGSRTVYGGVKLVELEFDTPFGPVDIIGNVLFDPPATGTFVYWDRADASQHIVELCFEVGSSDVRVVLTADATNGDLAFDQLFEVNSPAPNTGRLDPVTIANLMDAKNNYTQPQLFINADAKEFGGKGSIVGDMDFLQPEVLLGDINLDGNVSLLDVGPFVDLLMNGKYQEEADINM